LQLLDVEASERRGVVEVVTEGARRGSVLAQDVEIELVGPPVLVAPGSVRLRLRCGDDGVLALGHVGPPSLSLAVGAGPVMRADVSRVGEPSASTAAVVRPPSL